MMKLSNLALAICLVLTTTAQAQTKRTDLSLSDSFIQEKLKDAAQQISTLTAATPPDKFPKTFENGQQKFSNSSWWCSGFYPGTLLYLYEGTKNDTLLTLATDKLKPLAKEQFNKGTHDLGFMLFCSFGNALRLTGDSASYKDILLTGAESLASRYHDRQKAIKSWDWGSWEYAVIIDNMMNLEFLTQATKISKDKKYKDIAVQHANTTIKNHFRKDYSAYHVIDYNKETGAVSRKKNHQGAFDESAWSRGQGWALYGYTMMYRETGEKQFLKQAQHIASYILKHPQLPADLVPYWDFDKEKVPATSKMYKNKDLRDVSAAALYASALLELSQYTTGKEAKGYLGAAETLIKNLSGDPYLAKDGENGGYILKHSVGALPLDSEIDVPLTYADYYYVEALIRYQRLLAGKSIID
ncbi:glucuronyl hydrolase [Sphingobacterium psychroaquaticum]|uniref:glycoside hydrolase family 88 protein n=1 Tax=Sphingobacterium psychroaquaticum TaxID=561061 RepID=UPI00106AA697|nr:glycoside hydrolase family 88 protein [Sphingobacterium psychroaquaticum]QBQ39992.1 glucuronyl hydrolase [Sphingobacterium psychroaquaticum]